MADESWGAKALGEPLRCVTWAATLMAELSGGYVPSVDVAARPKVAREPATLKVSDLNDNVPPRRCCEMREASARGPLATLTVAAPLRRPCRSTRL